MFPSPGGAPFVISDAPPSDRPEPTIEIPLPGRGTGPLRATAKKTRIPAGDGQNPIYREDKGNE